MTAITNTQSDYTSRDLKQQGVWEWEHKLSERKAESMLIIKGQPLVRQATSQPIIRTVTRVYNGIYYPQLGRPGRMKFPFSNAGSPH